MTRAAKALTPKLRFPEFREWPKWDLLTLSSASDVNPKNGGLPKQFIYIDLESVKNSTLIERKEISRDAAPSRAQRLLSRKDIIYQTVRPYQRNNLFFDIDDGREYVASTGYAQIRAYGSPRFLYQLLHTDSFVRSVLARCTGSNYPAINPSALASIEVLLPKEGEQRKIADCLGSLDDLIAAEARKLEALRQHKKGLMQQLFPQPGETAPRLRFPEFVGQPLHHVRLRDLTEQSTARNGKKLSLEAVMGVNKEHGIVPMKKRLVAADISRYKLVRSNWFAYNPMRLNIGSIARYQGNGNILVSPDYVVFRCLERSMPTGLLPEYLDSFRSCWQWHVFVNEAGDGGVRVRIYYRDLAQLQLALPSIAEQRKIAECLGSLDALIAAGGRKLEALRQHKRGLMQQLFPNPKEGHA
ncbi:MAG: restriction endonuclease subunit S [Gammaproteobacteria bacterium]|nr:restriction endonuclease subunit S [Gammaproteobacteria bacterium]